SELGTTQAQIKELKMGTGESPQLANLQRKASALEQQMVEERRHILQGGGGLAARLAEYERLQLERDFARQALGAADEELARTRQEASRQLLYLERIVQP